MSSKVNEERTEGRYLEYGIHNSFDKYNSSETISIPLNVTNVESAIIIGKEKLEKILKNYEEHHKQNQKTMVHPPKTAFDDGPYSPRIIYKYNLSLDEIIQNHKDNITISLEINKDDIINMIIGAGPGSYNMIQTLQNKGYGSLLGGHSERRERNQSALQKEDEEVLKLLYKELTSK